MRMEDEDAAITLGISIPVYPSEESVLTEVHSDVSSDDSQLKDTFVDRLHFSNLPNSLDPNIGILGHLPSSNIEHEKSTLNSWNIEPSFIHVLPLSSSVSNESSILIFGGINPSSVLKREPVSLDDDDFVLGSTIFQFMLKSKIWHYYGTMIEPRCYHACTLNGSHVYITGGYSLLRREYGEMLALSSVDRLDLRDGKWQSCADMNISRATHAAVSHKGFLYVFGGRNSQGNMLASVEMYYPDQDAWIEITSLPQPTMGLSATCVADAIWLIGGVTNENHLDLSKCILSSVYSFIPSTRRWYAEEPLPYACAFSSCISNDDSVWLAGGCTFPKNSKENTMISCSTVLQLILSEKSLKWKSVASLLYPRHAVTTVLYDGCIYILAGIESDNKCASDKVEIISCTGNVRRLCAKIPVAMTGCSSVLILQEAGDYRCTDKANNVISGSLEGENYLYDMERDYLSEISGIPEDISERDINKHVISDECCSEIEGIPEDISQRDINKHVISDECCSEIESSKEAILPETERNSDSAVQPDITETVIKQIFDEEQVQSYCPETKERKEETSQNMRYRASMEILVNSNEINSKNVLQNKSNRASKWLNYYRNFIVSDEKMHKEVFHLKEPKINLKTEIDNAVLHENYKTAEVTHFEKVKNLMNEHEDSSGATSKQISVPCDEQSFMYIQSNISSSNSTVLEMDDISLVPPEATTITIDENSFPIILLMGGEYSRKTDKSRLILSYYCNENIWKPAGYMPDYRCHHCAILLNNKIYIIGGFNSENSKLCETITNKTSYYDINRKAWHHAAEMNCSRAHHSAVVLKNNIFVVGGRNKFGDIFSSVEVYSESNNEWKTCEALPYPILAAAAFSLKGILYVFGGITCKDEDEIISFRTAAFDPENNSWSFGSDMLIPLAFCGICCFSNAAWLFGGLTEEEGNLAISKDILKFDLLTETWSKIAELSVPRFASVTLLIGNKVYVIGGHNIHLKKEVATCELIDLLKNEISMCKSSPISVSARAGIVLPGMSDTETS